MEFSRPLDVVYCEYLIRRHWLVTTCTPRLTGRGESWERHPEGRGVCLVETSRTRAESAIGVDSPTASR